MSTAVGGVASSDSAGYGLDHLPYGVVEYDGRPRVAVRYGDAVLDLHETLGDDVFAADSLTPLLAAGPAVWRETRERVTEHLHGEPRLVPLADVHVLRAFDVADYVDFYCSEQHATNVGRIFRPDAEPLLPNWRWLPVGYHGRASTVVPSGTAVRRPRGQRRRPGEEVPSYGPSRKLDIEAELGFVVGAGTAVGSNVTTARFADHVFGVALVNDWSARDLQAWEYVPLGPFLAKSFATSISRWVTPLPALEAARVPLPGQHPAPLPHLRVEEPAGYDIDIEVLLNGEVVSRPPYAAMYWSPAQMLAHLTSNGAALTPGDLFASGTVSGDDADQRGSLLELTWDGREPLPGGRTFLEDGDEVTLRASAPGTAGGRIALGEVSGRIEPALD